MTKLFRKLIAMVVALSSIVAGQQSIAQIHIFLPDSGDIELSEQERNDLAVVAASLIPEPSEILMKSVDSGDGFAHIFDQRDEPEARYPITMTIVFPEVTVDQSRKQEPKHACEGSFAPIAWGRCRETSRSSLRVAGYDFVRINHESRTLENLAEMYAALDSAELESPTGALITSQGAHHILFSRTSGLYHVIGQTSNSEQYFAYLRPVEDIYGVRYEIAEWSCQ